MITLKIPHSISESSTHAIKQLQQQFSSVVRFAYNRAKEGMSQKDIRTKVKTLNSISDLNSWFLQCAILEGISIFKNNKDKKVIFGGAKLFEKRLMLKITHEELKDKRLLPISIQGEKLQYGNRSFDLSSISEGKIIFKINKETHLELSIPKLNKNYRRKIEFIGQQSILKNLTVSVKVNAKYIYLSYEEPKEQHQLILNENRYAGLDLNPNYIGLTIKDQNQILLAKCFDVKTLTNRIESEKNSSSSYRFKHLNNKLKHETLQISKEITNIVKQFRCKFVFIEDLKNIAQANLDRGHKTNRLTRNLWKRDYFVCNLEKKLKLANIKLFKINPCYSSTIGNLQYDYFDPINASIEIARRGFNVIIKKNKQFYPSDLSIKDQWKEHFRECINWKEVFDQTKNSGLRVRVSLEESRDRLNGVFRFFSVKSLVKVINFN